MVHCASSSGRCFRLPEPAKLLSKDQPATSPEKLCCKWQPPNPRKHRPLEAIPTHKSADQKLESTEVLTKAAFSSNPTFRKARFSELGYVDANCRFRKE